MSDDARDDGGLDALDALERAPGDIPAPSEVERAWRDDPESALVHGYFEARRSSVRAERVLARFRKRVAPRAVEPDLAPATPWPLRWLRWLVLPALTAALVVALWHRPARRTEAWAEFAPGQLKLVDSNAIRTLVRDGACVTLRACERDRNGRPKAVSLEQLVGVGVYEVDPNAGLSVSVTAPGVSVRVVGTRFRVAVRAAAVTISVGDGTVEVEVPGASVVRRVGSSEELTVDPARPPGEPMPFNRITDPDFGPGVTVRGGTSR